MSQRSQMDQLFLASLARLEEKVELLARELNEFKVQIAGRPHPPRPCEHLIKHIDEHQRRADATRTFWYHRLGNILDAVWKPVLMLLLLAGLFAGNVKIDFSNATQSTYKEVTK